MSKALEPAFPLIDDKAAMDVITTVSIEKRQQLHISRGVKGKWVVRIGGYSGWGYDFIEAS